MNLPVGNSLGRASNSVILHYFILLRSMQKSPGFHLIVDLILWLICAWHKLEAVSNYRAKDGRWVLIELSESTKVKQERDLRLSGNIQSNTCGYRHFSGEVLMRNTAVFKKNRCYRLEHFVTITVTNIVRTLWHIQCILQHCNCIQC